MINLEIQEYIKSLKLKELEELAALLKFRLAQEKVKSQIKNKEKQIKKINIYGN